MKWKELRSMPEADIRVKMEELKLELMKERAQIAVGTTPKSPGKIQRAKTTIARMMTVLHGGLTKKP